ncbi:E3 ubiquitin-protein ligase TRIM33-like [Asterias rubens]|uniref:E3 ubiquitin-protein ligase TRIM33-like n=1 Tax=Asterias rubens TaxID=7604 RepID=UPI001455C7AB|nr:E3 ubiquitin-protein ligase TRIM33-like [Asterias rubens]
MDIASTSSASTECLEVVQVKKEFKDTEAKDVPLPEDMDDLTDITCPLCQDYFHEPKILDCLHTVCRPCLEKGVSKKEDGFKAVLCPVCDVETRALNGLTGLMNNNTLRGLVEEAVLKDKISGDVSKIRCQGCVEDNTAVSRCMDCDNFLCLECQNAHQRLIALKNNNIVPMADLKSGKITFKSKLRDQNPKCSKHSDQNCCFFCITCEMLICTTCTVLDHCKPDHIYTDITGAIDCCRSEVGSLMTQAERSRESFQDAETLTKHAQSRLEQLNSNAQRKISAKADQEVAKIRNKESQLREALQLVHHQRVIALGKVRINNSKKVKMAKQNLKKIGKIMSRASHSEILSLKSKIKHHLKDLNSTRRDSVPYGLSYVNFKESKSNESLGKFQMTEKWDLKSKVCEENENTNQFDDLIHVAAFPSGNLLIFNRRRNQLMVYSPAGEQMKILPDEVGPLNISTAIAVVSEDRIVVTSNGAEKRSVKMFGPENIVLFDVTPWADSGKLACLTVVEGIQGQEIAVPFKIAVGDRGKGRIGLLDDAGSLLKTIPADHIGQYLTFNRATQHLIYTNYEMGRLVAVDLDSNIVFSVETSDMSGNQVFPTGVCCDDQGEIYVAAQKSKCKRGKDEIYHYTPGGIFANTEVKELFDAHGITFNIDDSLVVADCRSLKIFHHKEN